MLHINPILEQARKEDTVVKRVTATTDSASDSATTAPVTDKLATIEEALSVASVRIATSIQDLETNVKASKTATDVITSAVSDITSAAQLSAKLTDIANLQAENSTIDAFEAGGGTDAQVVLLTQLKVDSDRVTAILEERQLLAEEDRFGEGIGVVDTIINRFNTRLTDLQLNAAQAKQDQTVSQISNISAATESFARANTLTRKTTNEGVIEANYKAIEAEGAIKGAEARLKNIHSNATAMNALVTADARNVSTLLQAFRLEGEVQERELKKERLGFQREQMVVQREQWKIQLPAAQLALKQAELNLDKSKKLGPTQIAAAEQALAAATKRFNDQVATENSLVEAGQAAQALAGIPVEDRETIIFGLKQSGTVGAKYARLIELGGVPDAVLGLTPFEAKETVDIVAPSGNIKASTGVKLLAQISEKQAEKYRQPNAKIPRDRETQKVDFNQTAKEVITEFAADITIGNNANPYAPPPFTVLEQVKSVSSTVLYQKVLKALKMKETNPQTIMDTSISAILAGTVTPEEAAAGIEAIFDASALINNINEGGFRRVGLPNQTTYNVKLTRPPTFIEELKVGVAPRRFLESIGIVKERELFPNAIVSVDLMDGTKIQEMIIRIMSTTRASVKEGGQ